MGSPLLLLALGPLTLWGACFPFQVPEHPLLFVVMGAHSKGEVSCLAEVSD